MKKKLLSFVLGLFAIFSLICPITKTAYADTTEYTVNFYNTDNTLISTDTVAAGEFITTPTVTPDSGYVIVWYTSSAREVAYDFNNPTTTSVDLYAGQVEAYTVTYTKRAAGYTTGVAASEYETYSTVAVIKDSFTNAITGEALTGFVFSHWSLTPQGTAFDFYNTTISSNITLYPVYNVQTFAVKFYADGNLLDTVMVDYNTTVTPPTYDSATHEVVGWKVYGDTTNTLVDLSTINITADASYEAILEQVSVNITVSSTSSYYTLQQTPPTTLSSGGDLIVYLKLKDSYSKHALVASDLKITGTYNNIDINYESSTDTYTIVVFDVTTDLLFEMNVLPINQYKVTLPTVEGISYTITTPAADYTYAGGVYTLDVTKNFTFTVAVDEGYFAKTIAFSQCTKSGQTYILNVKADINIQSNCDVVKSYELTFSGDDNVTLNITDDYLQQDGDKYIYESGTMATFTASANAGYFIKNITGVSGTTNFSVPMTENKQVTFDVVACFNVTIVIPTGIENVIVTNYLARNLNVYTVESNSDIVINYTVAQSYSDSVVTLNSGSLVNVKDTNKFTVKSINADATITFEGLQLNDCAVTLTHNTMATLAANSTVSYGNDLEVTVTLTSAYNQDTLAVENISITGQYYECIVNGNIVTISTIQSAITVEVVGLEKNQYTVNVLANAFGTLIPSSATVVHGGNVELTPAFNQEYDRMVLASRNIAVSGTYTTCSVNNNVVYVINATTDLTIALQDITINKYLVKMPPVESGKFTLSTTSREIEYDGSINFSLTINEAYSHNLSTYKMYANGEELTGTNNGLVFSYSISNIKEDITLTITELRINVYTVDFIDTSVLVNDDGEQKHPTLSVSIVEHGTVITPIDGQKTGYEFLGWYQDHTMLTTFDFTRGITSNTKIYGKYEIRNYEIVFIANGRTVDTIIAYFGDKTADIAPTIPTIEGYTDTAPYWDFATAGLGVLVDKAATVNAIYTINTYTVTFRSAFSNTPLSTQIVLYGQDAVAPTNYDVDGYTFLYWDNVYNNIKENRVINAVYQINTYTITFLNGNTGAKVYESEADFNSTIARPLDSSIVKLGYTIYGWYTDADMTVPYNFSTSIRNDFTLYGDIAVTKLRLRFIADGIVVEETTVNFGENYTEVFPEIPDKKGHTALKWSQTSIEGMTNDLDVYAEYQINTYKVTFKYSDGTEEIMNVVYGTTISELPNKGQGFGVKVSADMNKLKNISSDVTVYVTVTNYSYIIYIACGVVAVGLIVTVVILSLRVKSSSVTIKASDKKAEKAEKTEE